MSSTSISTIILSGAAGGIIAITALTVLGPAIVGQDFHTSPSAMTTEVLRPTPIAEVDGPLRKLRVRRGDDLSYHVVAKVNNQPVQMLVDTGANITVINRRDADRIGLPTGSLNSIDVIGIAPVATSYRSIGRWPIQLGPISLANVPIAIDDSNSLRASILGQDSFCNVKEIKIENQTIEFTHDQPVAEGCSINP